MTTKKLCQLFQRLHLPFRGTAVSKYSTAVYQQNSSSNKFECVPESLKVKNSSIYEPKLQLASLRNGVNSLDFGLPTHRGWINTIIDSPLSRKNDIIDPIKNQQSKEDEATNKIIDLPTTINSIKIDKQAARLIVIRRRKMRRHKLRKLRKKMKYVWRKIKQKRELLKEKAFHAELLAQIREAEKFDAKSYVKSRLDILDNVRIPSKWKGEIIPESMIRQFMREEEEIREKRRAIPQLRDEK